MNTLVIVDRNDLSTFKPKLMLGGFPAVLVRIGNSRYPRSICFPELPFAKDYEAIHEVTFDNTSPRAIYMTKNPREANLRPMNADMAADLVAFLRANVGVKTTVVLSEHFGMSKTGTLALSLYEYCRMENRIRDSAQSMDFFINGHILKLMREAFGLKKEELDSLYHDVFGSRLTPSLNGLVV